MKKLITILLCVMFLAGCGLQEMDNTPTQKAEALLGTYQSLDETILSDLEKEVKENDEYTEEQKENYKELMKDQYRNLQYDIREEKVDGNQATVDVQIEVRDYGKVIQNADKYLKDNPDLFEDEKGNFDPIRYMTYQIKQMQQNNEHVKYTLHLKAHKEKKEWVLDDLSKEDIQKIQGIYHK